MAGLQPGDDYPRWVQRIAEEESRLQGNSKGHGGKFPFGCRPAQVHALFLWERSRQDANCWCCARRGNFEPLKKRAIANGEYNSDNFLLDFI